MVKTLPFSATEYKDVNVCFSPYKLSNDALEYETKIFVRK